MTTWQVRILCLALLAFAALSPAWAAEGTLRDGPRVGGYRSLVYLPAVRFLGGMAVGRFFEKTHHARDGAAAGLADDLDGLAQFFFQSFSFQPGGNI